MASKKSEFHLYLEGILGLGPLLKNPPEWADEVEIIVYWQDSEGVTDALRPRRKGEPDREVRVVAANGGSARIGLLEQTENEEKYSDGNN